VSAASIFAGLDSDWELEADPEPKRTCGRCGRPADGLCGYAGLILEEVCFRCRAMVARESITTVDHADPEHHCLIEAARTAPRGSVQSASTDITRSMLLRARRGCPCRSCARIRGRSPRLSLVPKVA
jgi:hypothetical protein